MAFNGGNRNHTNMTGDREMGRKVFGPNAKIPGGHTRTAIGRISENTEDTGGKEAYSWHCHSGEPLHEKVDQVLVVKF